MTKHPLKDMIRWQTETNIFRVLFHIESEDDPQECIDFCLDNGWQVGIVINPDTDINKVIPFAEKSRCNNVYDSHPWQTRTKNDARN